jgi:hypothetical protein
MLFMSQCLQLSLYHFLFVLQIRNFLQLVHHLLNLLLVTAVTLEVILYI